MNCVCYQYLKKIVYQIKCYRAILELFKKIELFLMFLRSTPIVKSDFV